jgi:hypothetical protein
MHLLEAIMVGSIGGLFFLPIGLLCVAFWLWMIVDCARHETGSTMVAWLLLILFVGVLGAPLYFFLRRVPRVQSAEFQPEAPLYQPWRKDERIRKKSCG